MELGWAPDGIPAGQPQQATLEAIEQFNGRSRDGVFDPDRHGGCLARIP